ncbi:PREDICTED: uncharacterized protein LOC109192117 [Ipomoea nil]|uniref:uncharacterized protein LOC109192117 n=1 Tax=Ipomoea nil TaxID=35883 RepID=UPI00090169B1|nr:PREDICTED: uncharacterized protein LOC109192117 [Ipomoea nil]
MEPSTTTTSSPRISFSADFLDGGEEEEEEKDFISITPSSDTEKDVRKKEKVRNNVAAEFEFLSSKMNSESMITADELFFEGKLRPFWQMQQQQCEKLSKISLKTEKHAAAGEEEKEESCGRAAAVSWFLDEDPSPRPPKCTVLWKELLRLRKQRGSSSLSPSSSTSSSSSSGSSVSGGDESKERENKSNVKMRVKKGLERTRSATIRVRPVINMPICSQGKTTAALPPIFSSFKKASKLER